MPARRALAFATLHDAVADARLLAVGGYERAGNWSLGQCCCHLANWLRYPLDGFPRVPLPFRLGAWVVRNTAGPAQKRNLLATGSIRPGLPTLPQSVPARLTSARRVVTPADDLGAVAEFEDQARRVAEFAGTPHPSPLLGPLTADELRRLSCIHAAHHLSFLTPIQNASPGST